MNCELPSFKSLEKHHLGYIDRNQQVSGLIKKFKEKSRRVDFVPRNVKVEGFNVRLASLT